MQIFKNKFFLFVLSVLVVGGAFIMFRPASETMSKDAMKAWIQVGYAKQFCDVVYPNVASCLTIDANQCLSFANQQLEPCIESITANLPEVIANEDSKTIYKSVSQCFEQNMHKVLLEQYLVETPECRAKFS